MKYCYTYILKDVFFFKTSEIYHLALTNWIAAWCDTTLTTNNWRLKEYLYKTSYDEFDVTGFIYICQEVRSLLTRPSLQWFNAEFRFSFVVQDIVTIFQSRKVVSAPYDTKFTLQEENRLNFSNRFHTELHSFNILTFQTLFFFSRWIYLTSVTYIKKLKTDRIRHALFKEQIIVN